MKGRECHQVRALTHRIRQLAIDTVPFGMFGPTPFKGGGWTCSDISGSFLSTLQRELQHKGAATGDGSELAMGPVHSPS
jgi:hypothetical protein